MARTDRLIDNRLPVAERADRRTAGRIDGSLIDLLAGALQSQNLLFEFAVRVSHFNSQHEAVQLVLAARILSLIFKWVLRGADKSLKPPHCPMGHTCPKQMDP